MWVPDPVDVFVPAKKISESKGQMQVELKSGESKAFKSSECTPFNRSSLARVVQDLTLLDDMTPQLILHNLKRRFADGHIYTNVGNILISINPYKRLPLYTDEIVHKCVLLYPSHRPLLVNINV